MSFSATDNVGNTNTAPASYDILDPTSVTNPNNPGKTPTTPSSPTDRTTGSSGGSMGGGTGSGGTQGSSHTQASKTNTNSNNGGSNNSNSEGINPGDRETQNISPEEPYTFWNFIGELLLYLKDIGHILLLVFMFFFYLAVLSGGIGSGLIIIGLGIIICLGLLLIYWAIQKIFEGLFKPRKPGG